jgi:hypothetical protein
MGRWAQCYLKIPMVKNLIFLFLTNIISIVSPSQFVLENKNSHYYQEKIQWNVKEQNFKDTIVLFRNYIKDLDDKRLICNDNFIDIKIEKLIWGCKYISVLLEYQKRLNKFSIFSYQNSGKNEIIAKFYLCDRITKRTVEHLRLKIINYKIVGINVLPGIFEGFIQIEDFDNMKLDRID